jgi:AraC-like DNA-binding protein
MHPQPELPTAAPRLKTEFIENAVLELLESRQMLVGIATLCKDIGVHRRQFWKCCLEELHHTPSQVLDYIRAERMLRAFDANRHEKIYNVCKELGFRTEGAMVDFCRRMFGQLPTEVRANATDARRVFKTKYAKLAERIDEIRTMNATKTKHHFDVLTSATNHQSQSPKSITKVNHQSQSPKPHRNKLTKKK